MTPSVGRIVHYVSYGTPNGEYGKECRAAIVTEVLEFEPGSAEEHRAGEVGLCVFNPTGLFLNRGVPHNENVVERPGGTWHWPERVD